ncbi:MAG: hypothetical protein V4561_02610 [Bacteroidota bacterium]|jgi:hypothetical protein
MKNLIFIFALVIGCSLNSSAQTSTISTQNSDAVKNYDGVRGNFDYALSATERLNVNYSLTPKNPSTVAHLMLHTPDPMPLSAKIMNAAGKVVMTWTPDTKVYLYNADLNIASLEAGTYTVNVYMGSDSKSIHNFSFSKQ